MLRWHEINFKNAVKFGLVGKFIFPASKAGLEEPHQNGSRGCLGSQRGVAKSRLLPGRGGNVIRLIFTLLLLIALMKLAKCA